MRKFALIALKIPFIKYILEMYLNRQFLGEYLEVYNDLKKWKKDIRQSLRSKKFQKENNFFIVSSLGDSIQEIKLLLMTALPLRLQGGEGAAVLDKFQFWQIRFLKAFGIKNFVFWDDFQLTNSEKEELKKSSKLLINENFDFKFSSIKNLSINGVKLGSQILSQIGRDDMSAGFDPEEYKTRVVSLLEYSLEKTMISKKILLYLQSKKFEKGFTVEINGPKIGPLVCNATKLNVDIIQVVQPSRDDALILKRINTESRNYHPNSLSDKSVSKIYNNPITPEIRQLVKEEFDNRYNGKWFLQSRNQPSNDRITRKDLIEKYNLNPELKICCVFSHVLWDANLFYGDDIFEDYADWFHQTVAEAIKNPHINFLIKLHPANIWKKKYENKDQESFAELELIKSKIGKLPEHVKIILPSETFSTLSLFQNIDYAITVRGTSGLEAPCFGVKTILAGTGRYSGKGFTHDAISVEEYKQLILNLHNVEPMTDLEIEKAIKHAYGVFKLRPWEFKYFECFFNYKETGRSLLDHNLSINPKVINDSIGVNVQSHLYKWLKSQEIDYLA